MTEKSKQKTTSFKRDIKQQAGEGSVKKLLIRPMKNNGERITEIAKFFVLKSDS